MALEKFINIYSGIFGILTFLLGLFLGNRLAIGRDKRKEFNEIADEIYSVLLKKREGAEKGLIWNGPTKEQFAHLIRRASSVAKLSISKSIEKYNKAIDQNNISHDSYGQLFYSRPEEVTNAIDLLLQHVQRK